MTEHIQVSPELPLLIVNRHRQRWNPLLNSAISFSESQLLTLTCIQHLYEVSIVWVAQGNSALPATNKSICQAVTPGGCVVGGRKLQVAPVGTAVYYSWLSNKKQIAYRVTCTCDGSGKEDSKFLCVPHEIRQWAERHGDCK